MVPVLNVTHAGASQRQEDHLRDGFVEAQHRIQWMVLALSMMNRQGLALQTQAMRLKKAEGTVLQTQTARFVEDRARKAPGRALSRR